MTQGSALGLRPTTRTLTTPAAALVLAGSLVACGAPTAGPSKMVSSPSPTAGETSPTLSTLPSPVPPSKPKSWVHADASAAVDAAIYFKDLYNYALETGDVSEWRALSEPECEFCRGIGDDIETAYAAGSHYEGGEVTLTASVVVEHSATLGTYGVQHTYSSTASVTVAPDGTRAEASAAQRGYVVFDVLPTGSGWWLVEARRRETSLTETDPAER